MSITLKPMNWNIKKIVNIKAPLNMRNDKTKPPCDKWSVPYDTVFLKL